MSTIGRAADCMDARGRVCVCVFMRNDFTGPLMMQAPFHPHFRGRGNSRSGLVQCGRGSQSPLINYVMEKCLVGSTCEVAVCEQSALMRWEAGKHATRLKKKPDFHSFLLKREDGASARM